MSLKTSLKTLMACGALLGLLTGMSFAQRRVTPIGTTPAGARMPSAIHGGEVPSTPTLPSQTGMSSHAPTTTVAPNTTTAPATKTVTPNTTTVPDRVISPTPPTISPTTRDINDHSPTLPNN